MKSKLSTIIITTISLLSVLLFVNYFTGFGYYLPHQTMVIYEWETNDIFARSEPQFFTINSTALEQNGYIDENR